MPEEEEDINVYSKEDEEEDDGDEEEEEEDLEGEEDSDEEDLVLDSPSTSSDDPNHKNSSSLLPLETLPTTITTTPVVSLSTTTTHAASAITNIATPTVVNGSPEPKRLKIEEPVFTPTTIEEKKPSTFDDSRRLFQRLWTDEDEIGLLQGFLDYIKQRGYKNSSHHHDTAPFYDQIKTKLQLDFNKNQLVEKLRRLKKKYRNVINRISSGKDFSFKSPHDQATFEISKKIWGVTGTVIGEAGVEEEEGNPQNVEINNQALVQNGADINDSEKKVPRSRKRPRKMIEEPNIANPSNLSNIPVNLSIPSVIEDTVKSCLSPLFKELLQSAINGPCNVRGLGGMAVNPLLLNFGGNSSMKLLGGEMVDEKWRKQQILELEVHSKRMELVQDQIKLALEELKSTGNS